MLSTKGKIVKPAGVTPNPFEQSVAQALIDLEHAPAEMADLKNLHITGAKELTTPAGAKAVIIFVPVPQLKAFQKLSSRLVPELEKKFSGSNVLIIAQRRILAPAKRGYKLKQPRPRSRTLTAVHEAILDDIAHPVDIVGKRTVHRLDGSKTIKMSVFHTKFHEPQFNIFSYYFSHLDPKEKANVEPKLDVFRHVYRTLTGKDAVFEFPQ